MPNKISTRTCSFAALLAFGLVVSAMPAHAGFEWVAPPDAAPRPTGNGYAAPPPSNAPEVISPVIITGDNGPSMQTTTSYPSPSYPAPSYKSDAAPMPNLANETIAIPASSGDVVQGFGTEVPLALALRQILPVGMNFSIDQTIDMNTTVSYKGGKSWRETLRDMLTPAGLVAREQGATLTISRAPQTAAVLPTNPAPVFDSGAPVPMPVPANHSPSFYNAPRASDPTPVNVAAPDGWSAERGDTLRKVLTEWCKRSGVELQWLAEYDYPMEASAHFNGGFEDAVRLLLAGFVNARPQPVAELHMNPAAGQMLLVIQSRGNAYSN